MRTWDDAERIMRRETAVMLRGGPPMLLPLVMVGAARPAAVIALRGLDPDRPRRSLAELVLLAAAFDPTRVGVGLVVPDAPDRRRGLLVVHDLEAVADGVVEQLRAWAWRRLAGRVLWLPVQARRWRVDDSLAAMLAREVVEQRSGGRDTAMLETLLTRSKAAGHRVRLGAGLR